MTARELPALRFRADGECECDWHLGYDVLNPHAVVDAPQIRWIVVNLHPVWHTEAEVAEDIRRRLVRAGANDEQIEASVALAIDCHRQGLATYAQAGGL